MLTPEKLAAPNTEHAHQVAIMQWRAMNLDRLPDLKWLYAIPNGGDRAPAVAARLKAEGVRSGVSDMCLPVARGGYFGLYIELKKPGNWSGESDKQKEFGAYVIDQGYWYTCVDSWEAATQILDNYLQLYHTVAQLPELPL